MPGNGSKPPIKMLITGGLFIFLPTLSNFQTMCWIPTAANHRPCNSRGLAICVAPNGLSCNDGRGGELQRNKFQLLANFLPSQVVFYDILLYNVGPPWPPQL